MLVVTNSLSVGTEALSRFWWLPHLVVHDFHDIFFSQFSLGASCGVHETNPWRHRSFLQHSPFSRIQIDAEASVYFRLHAAPVGVVKSVRPQGETCKTQSPI